MANRFQKEIVTNQLTLTTAIILSVAFWIAGYMIRPVADLPETIGAYAIYAIIGYMLIVINRTFAIIRIRASFQTVIFLLLTSILPNIHLVNKGCIVAFLCLVSMFLIFQSYQMERSSGLLFHAFLLWSVGCLLIPKIVWIIPYLWFICNVFKTLDLKSLLASIFGFSIPLALYAVYDYFFYQNANLIAKATEVISLEDLSVATSQLALVTTLIFLLVIQLVSSFHSIMFSMEEKVQTRCYLQFLMVFVPILLVIAICNLSDAWQIIPIMLPGISLLFGHFATLSNSKLSNRVFIAVFICIIPVFLINLLF